MESEGLGMSEEQVTVRRKSDKTLIRRISCNKTTNTIAVGGTPLVCWNMVEISEWTDDDGHVYLRFEPIR